MNTLEEHYLSDEQVADIVQDISDRMKFPIMGAGGGFAPIGVINALMGTSAPQGWLVCDGHVYNITDYPELASYFASHFGASNKFGGNGTTTFAVPDLRGEFLRGTGTNSHANQGSGANVGTHQDGTEHLWLQSGDGSMLSFGKATPSADKIDYGSSKGNLPWVSKGGASSGTTYNQTFTSRPTNTSVLFIIKATIAGDPNAHQYSTSEQVVGRWIDGKPIYEKTINFGALPNATTKDVSTGLSNVRVREMKAYAYNSSTGTVQPIPQTSQTAANVLQLLCKTNGTTISISSGYNYSAYTECYVTLQYTKTTD